MPRFSGGCEKRASERKERADEAGEKLRIVGGIILGLQGAIRMGTTELRREIKKAVDRLPAEHLESVVDYIHFLNRPSVAQRISVAEKAIASGKGTNWRKVGCC